jgi:HEAT repeat protein
MLRAVAAPERFLHGGGFARALREVVRRTRASQRSVELGVALPPDLARFLAVVDGGSFADFVARPALPAFPTLLRAAGRGGPALVRLVALLAGAVPFGETKNGETLVYFLGDPPSRSVIVAMSAPPARGQGRVKARLVCRGAAELAVMCSLQAIGERPEPPVFGVAEEEAIRALLDRARSLTLVTNGTPAQARQAVRALGLKPLDVPPAEPPPATRARRRSAPRTSPLALGALVEAFFRESTAELGPRLAAHASSPDAVVRAAVALLSSTLEGKTRPLLFGDLAARRQLAVRAQQKPRVAAPQSAMEITHRIVAHFDSLPEAAESYAALHEREETLLALAQLGDHAISPVLLARALTGDAGAVDMLGALGDRSLVPLVVPEGVPQALQAGLLRGEPSRVRLYEAAVVRMVVAVGARREAKPALRLLLEANPMTNWREGLERGVLVRELVVALGEVEDEASSSLLLAMLESKSQEYKSIVHAAAHALGRLRHVPALPALEQLLLSPKEPITCEAVWAVGEIGRAHAEARESAGTLLDRLKGLEPGAEVTRLTALSKLRSGKTAPRAPALRLALDRALWEPAYRQEETSRRQTWGLRALEELATIARDEGLETGSLFLGHEAVRHFVTREDHRVRRAAETAFAAWSIPVPKVRRYFSFVLPSIEDTGGLDALLEAVRDRLGIFRHNVARRLAEIGDERAVRPLAEATARLFSEPAASTYEYDDAPPHLVAFVRALARLNRPEGNDVLIDGLRSNNHHVRAVIAENAPEDERFVPELMTMLGDPRSFLRSRAEKSLTSLGAIQAPIVDPQSTEVRVVRRLEG